MLHFRTLSNFIKIVLIPEIKKRTLKKIINISQLPLYVYQFRLIQEKITDDKIKNIVEINDELKIIVNVKAKKPIKQGEEVLIKDIYTEECFIVPPTSNSKPVSFIMFKALFMNYFIWMDFTPNIPRNIVGIKEEKLNSFPYPIIDFINYDYFNRQIEPYEKLKLLANNNWPPAPIYFPNILINIKEDPSIVTNNKIIDLISGAFSETYWSDRIEFWEKVNLFPNRLNYIIKVIEYYKKEDYIALIFVLLPQFEGIIRDYLISQNIRISRKEDFVDLIKKFKKIVFEREVIVFPKDIFLIIFDYLESGSFWKDSSQISDPAKEVNRHGILHGLFFGFECKEIALKYLLLFESLSFLLFHDRIVSGTL